jgi:tetratricopeptide (TPR) repeat protein
MLGFLIIAPAQQPALGQTEPVVQNLLDEYSESPRLNYFAGRFYRIHERPKDSYTYFTKAVQLSPHLEEGHLALAEYHYSQGKFNNAIRSYQRVVSLNPTNAEAYDYLIDLHQHQKSLDKLCDVWMSRYRANMRNEVLKEHLIEALHKAGRYEDAQQIVAQN